jgi:hypothetical protein
MRKVTAHRNPRNEKRRVAKAFAQSQRDRVAIGDTSGQFIPSRKTFRCMTNGALCATIRDGILWRKN